MQTKKKTPSKRTTKKTTSSKLKRSQSKKTKPVVTKRSVVKKGKISLSPTKVIWLCCAVIVICLALLLVTSVGDKKNVPAITERFEKEEVTPLTPPVKEPEKPVVTIAPSEDELVAKKTTPPKQSPKPTESVEQKKEKTVVTEKKETPKQQSTFNFPTAVNHAELVFVFDDGGQNLNQLQPFLELPIPITVAVLPKLPHSVETAARVRKSGNEVMLHQPMQAINSGVNPGPGAIKPEMTALEIDELVQSNIEEIAPIAGMNNHEGSLITADAAKIGVVLDVADKNGIFFLDSRTNVETKVPEVSKKSGYSWYERNGRFLDNEKTREEFLTELRKNLDIANKSGSVIMIGHIWSADYLPALIKEVYPELKEKGYTFKTVSGSSAKRR